METRKNLTLGFTDFRRSFYELYPNGILMSYEQIPVSHFSRKTLPYGQLLLALIQYLHHTEIFGKINLYVTFESDKHFPNGTYRSLLRKINRSEIDIGPKVLIMDENTTKATDFSYPYRISDHTFVTPKPEYKPHIFGIIQTFSLPVWITLLLVLFTTTFVYCFFLKHKCNLNKIVLHMFAILMKQSVLLVHSSVAENLFLYSWVLGAMILCLSHDSVILSFMTFPPLTKIKHLSDLSSAVQEGFYHCIGFIAQSLLDTEEEDLKVIAEDMLKNELKFKPLYESFLRGNGSSNIAFLTETSTLDMFAGKFFISDDRFYERMGAMLVRRGFCCKELIDTFVHRMMSSGIYFKYFSDYNYVFSSFTGIRERETQKRKLTLTDVAPAFIFLLCGYFVSFLLLIGEILSKRKKVKYLKKKRNKVCNEDSV